MGKTLPKPYPGQSIDEYREQLVNFQKNYWSFLKPYKGGSKFIPLPPLTLYKNYQMSARKLSEHVEEELFNKEKRVTVDPKKVIKTTPKILKESVLGQSEEQPVKKKKPYYRKKYNKPKVEVVIPEPVVDKKYFLIGFVAGVVITSIIARLIWSFN